MEGVSTISTNLYFRPMKISSDIFTDHVVSLVNRTSCIFVLYCILLEKEKREKKECLVP